MPNWTHWCFFTRYVTFLGATVIFACRDITKAERAAADVRKETNNNNIHVKLVDLSSLESVRNFCKNFKPEKVDILINNAGTCIFSRII